MRKRGCCVPGCVRPAAYRLWPVLRDDRGRARKLCSVHLGPVAQGWVDSDAGPERVKAIPL
jgi:hypothetical protein